MDAFLSNDEWEAASKLSSADNLVKWELVPTMTIFSVQYIKKIDTKIKHSWDVYVMCFTDAAGNDMKTFCPSSFLRTIRRKRQPSERPYFVSFGLKDQGYSKEVASYELTFKDTGKNWDIFLEPE